MRVLLGLGWRELENPRTSDKCESCLWCPLDAVFAPEEENLGETAPFTNTVREMSEDKRAGVEFHPCRRLLTPSHMDGESSNVAALPFGCVTIRLGCFLDFTRDAEQRKN